MRICIFEDSGVQFLEPLTLTRPAFALWCGAEPLIDRHRRTFAASEVGAWVRPELAELCRVEYPHLPVNDAAWLRSGPAVLINARWLPGLKHVPTTATPGVGLVGGQVAYLAVPETDLPPAGSDDFDTWLAAWKQRLPTHDAGGTLLDYLGTAVDHNGEALCRDWEWFQSRHVGRRPEQVAVLGPADRLVLAEDAALEPFVTVDTRNGPVLIDRGAVVHSFTRIEGPCYIGPGTWLLGAKLRGGSTLGPHCRVGGEVEASILQGFSNKYHDGFLGHSYVGSWVNLAAGTQTSDLRNDYDRVRIVVAGQRRATGSTKVGSYFGDHSKTGLGALLNTGSVIGAFCNLLPSGALLPRAVPSFCQVSQAQIQEVWDLRKLFSTATTVMRRRGVDLTDVHREFYTTLFERTADQRRRALRESEVRRLRRSV